MKPSSITTLICATLVAIGTACWLSATEPASRKPYPKATPPPPPSDVYTPSKEPAPTSKQIEQALREHDAMLAMVIERALVSRDPRQRETAFAILMPELLQVDPQRVVAMLARQQPGEARDVLRDEMARQWVVRDRDAAVDWMKSLLSEERRNAAQTAVSSLAAIDPGQAIYVADQFGIGDDDGYVEHLVQIWAEEDFDAATRWLDSQPAGPRTDRLRERIQHVRRQASVVRAS
ncbi:MAG TPA: hypothetical protein VFO82_15110 [Steroidobacteraceae bacterium]|nr:hypothetical protein [Steroidobacteraceae bacterium]